LGSWKNGIALGSKEIGELVVYVSGNGIWGFNSKSDKYHYPSFRYGQSILPGNLIWFKDAANARAQGYVELWSSDVTKVAAYALTK